ncbi:MAG: mechanosensitive ion channel family protein [Pyrinomonadaceae bacterium]
MIVTPVAEGGFAIAVAGRTPIGLWLWQQGYTEWFKRLWKNYINAAWEVGNFRISLASLVLGTLVLLAALVVSRYLQSFLERRLAARAHIDPGIQYTILRLAHYVIVAVGVLVAFRFAFNADLTSLAVLFTALSVGIGFGLQFIAGDIASGFILLFERPVRVGDFVSVTGPDGKVTEGRVASINLRTTMIQTNDHISVIVPNSKLVNQNLVNWSYGGRRSRIAVPVAVSYDSDVDLVTATLLRAAEGVNHLLAEPKPSVQFMGFGDSALDFRLLVWTDRPRRYPQIKSDINYRIRRLFLEAGIEIPFPQRDLNLRGGSFRVAPELAGRGRGERKEREDGKALTS